MNQTHKELLDELHDLINRFCEIACTHHEYAANFSKDLNEKIEGVIYDEFNTLYALHMEKLTAATGIELYGLQTKNRLTIPRKRRKWYSFWKKTRNRAAILVENEIYDHYEDLFQDLANRTTSITGLAGDPTCDPDEPSPEGPPETYPAPPPEKETEKPKETWEERENAIPSETIANDA